MYAVVQVRGVVKTRRDIKDTLKMLRLHHINHCVLVPDTPENLGMIRKVKDYVAYGEADAQTIETLLLTRGRVIGDAPLTDEYIKLNSTYSNIAEFAQALASGETKLREIPGLKPVLRLHPPRKGYKTTKRTCGGGTHKNRRGAGNRGGRGRAGINAHHFVKWYKEMGGPVFGKNGFSNSSQTTVTVIDVGIIDQIIPSLLAQGIAKNEGDVIVINTADMGIEKVLGSGKVTKKMNISAQAFSESAKAKIEKMGGKTQIV
jgi:50S ribosomal protein uL30